MFGIQQRADTQGGNATFCQVYFHGETPACNSDVHAIRVPGSEDCQAKLPPQPHTANPGIATKPPHHEKAKIMAEYKPVTDLLTALILVTDLLEVSIPEDKLSQAFYAYALRSAREQIHNAAASIPTIF